MMTRKEKEAIQILHDYADDLRRKGIKFPEPKDDKQLAALVISFLETEYRVEDERLNYHQQTSTMNISAFDKRFIAAQVIIQRETKEEEEED